jgi:hypothetical protein
MKTLTFLFMVLLLGASAMGASSRLDFTSPGDDGRFGCAKKYVVAYDTIGTNVTDAKWNILNHWTFTAPPLCAGSHETRYVGGLIQGKIYYFALKTSDDAGNVSAISNIACDTAKAIAPPDSVSLKRGP